MAKYISGAKSLAAMLDTEKPHSSITDWVEILSSDRYEEDSLDGIPELIESVRIQGYEGIQESSRALRKKLKYGNVHRQIRAMTILRALTENSNKTYQHQFMNAQLQQKFKDMATDSLTDPKVKRKMIAVFHAWSLAYADDPRMREVAGLYAQYSGKTTIRQPVRKTTLPAGTTSTSSPTTTKPTAQSGFEDLEHSWAPTGKSQASSADYADLAAAKEDAERRKQAREAQAALEAREAEIERRERAIKMKEVDKARSEDARRLAIGEEERRKREAEEREAARLRAKQDKNKPQVKKIPFNFEKERPQIIVSIANASQAANNLVNALRHVNREKESVTVNIKVLEYLEKAKVARRPIIRYIQIVTHEEFVGTLLGANEQIVEAIQLYDKLSKPYVLDSDSEHETPKKEPKSDREVEELRKRMEAQKLEEARETELERMQAKQKAESKRVKEKRAAERERYEREKAERERYERERYDGYGGGGRRQSQGRLPPPMTPDEEPSRYDYDMGSLSDFSDYDSSDEEYRREQSRSQSRRPSAAAGSSKPRAQPQYNSLDDDDEAPIRGGSSSKTAEFDPFADPDDFLGSIGGSGKHKPHERMEWAAI